MSLKRFAWTCADVLFQLMIWTAIAVLSGVQWMHKRFLHFRGRG